MQNHQQNIYNIEKIQDVEHDQISIRIGLYKL